MAEPGLGLAGDSRKLTIVSWGEVLWDVFPDAEHLGGSAANVAFHVAQQGHSSLLVSRIGADERGARARRQLEASGVDLSGVTVDQDSPTGHVHIRFVEGEPEFTIGAKVAWDAIAPAPELLERICQADAFCYGTLAQRSRLVRGRLLETLQAIRARGELPNHSAAPPPRPLCVLDLNLRPPFTDRETILEAIETADVLKLNEAELDWVGSALNTEEPLGCLLENFSVQLIALTLAEKGARLITHQETHSVSGIPVEGGDPVGAGDSFVAALSIGLALGRPLTEVLESANRRAAWVASQNGAMPTP